jgi:alpha-tubulin suppressor-like RCC1 family protein
MIAAISPRSPVSGCTATAQSIDQGDQIMKRHRASQAGKRLASFAVTAALSATVTVVPSASPAAAADSAGTLRAWGLNAFGQVGDGTTDSRPTPTPVSNLSGMREVEAGTSHNLAIAADQTVRAWGLNNLGQLGDGTTDNRPVAVRVRDLTGVTAVSAGGGHSLAVKADGTVWAWGNNDLGQLGDGSEVDRNRPVRVQGLPGPASVRISAGAGHSVVRLRDGSLWAWGRNNNGQLGDGSTNDSPRPVGVQQFPGQALAVDAGIDHTIALRTDGTVFAWGDNAFGQLGDGTVNDRPLPGQVHQLNNVIQISAGGYHNLVRRAGAPRTAFAWGDNRYGQLGDGTPALRSTVPVRIQRLVDPNSVRAGAFHSLGQETNGTTPVRAWVTTPSASSATAQTTTSTSPSSCPVWPATWSTSPPAASIPSAWW